MFTEKHFASSFTRIPYRILPGSTFELRCAALHAPSLPLLYHFFSKVKAFCCIIENCYILCACGKSKQAQEADDLILAIGEVSLDSAAAIETAENAVSELSDRQRNQLENREILESARSTFSNLQYVQSHPFEYPLPLDFSWEMSLADAEKFGFDLSPIEPD